MPRSSAFASFQNFSQDQSARAAKASSLSRAQPPQDAQASRLARALASNDAVPLKAVPALVATPQTCSRTGQPRSVALPHRRNHPLGRVRNRAEAPDEKE